MVIHHIHLKAVTLNPTNIIRVHTIPIRQVRQRHRIRMVQHNLDNRAINHNSITGGISNNIMAVISNNKEINNNNKNKETYRVSSFLLNRNEALVSSVYMQYFFLLAQKIHFSIKWKYHQK